MKFRSLIFANLFRKKLRLVQMLRQGRKALEHGTIRRGQAKDGRHLGDQNVYRDACKETDSHRRRQQICDPAQTEYATDDEYKTNHERQHDSECPVFRRTEHSHKGETSGKDRSDG